MGRKFRISTSLIFYTSNSKKITSIGKKYRVGFNVEKNTITIYKKQMKPEELISALNEITERYLLRALKLTKYPESPIPLDNFIPELKE